MVCLRIEETAVQRRWRLIEANRSLLANKYRLSQEEEIEILDVDNLAVREAQINRLGIIRKNRDEGAV